ncbi:unconventional myosin-XVIIIa-like, partial [Diretmus argenteus]
MAFSSRFSFWEQKVKEDNKPGAKSPDSDPAGLNSRAQSVPALDPGRGLFRAKSPPVGAPVEPAARVRSPSPPRVRRTVYVPERFKSPELPSRTPAPFKGPEPPQAPMSLEPVMNGDSKQNGTVNRSALNGTATGQPDVTDDQGMTRKKVVKVVRRVVRKVLPTDEEEAMTLTPAPAPASASVPKGPKMSAFSFKHDTIKVEAKDDISLGLSSLMSRGRSRDPHPRIRKSEPPEKAEPAVEAKDEKKEGKDVPKAQEPKSLSPDRKQEVKTPAVPVVRTTAPPETSTASKTVPFKPSSLPPVVGFIPAPKPSPMSPPPAFIPAPKPSPMSPPPAFIPAPKPSPMSPPPAFIPAPKPSPMSPPPAFIPAPKPSPMSPPPAFIPAPKPSPMSPPPAFIPAPKPSSMSPPPAFIPAPKPSPMSPPPAFIPAPKPSPMSPPPAFIPAPKPSPMSPPPGFIPAPKPSPMSLMSAAATKSTATAPKPSPLPPPAGFIPPSKPSPCSPPAGFVPHPAKPSPLSPPPGSLPAPKQPSGEKIEEAPLSPTEEAQRRLMRIFTAPLEPAVSASTSIQAPVPAPQKPRGPPQGAVEEDPVALLQGSHAAAQQPQVKTEEQIAAEQAWYGSEKVWLVHKDGFSLATMVKTEPGSLPEGKVKIKLEHDGSILDVDEDDVEKANPPSFDRSEDLASLLYLNESSVMHSLRQRYGGNLIHTYAGPNMVVINPLSTPSMYSEKVMHMFKGCRREDSAPHVYAVAQSAYRNLLTTRQDQSIVLLGKSGSGKTTNCQHLVQYLVSIAGSTGKICSAEKWQAVYTILEAFGNSATSMNTNASRFSHIVSLDFDQAGQVASASIQTMLLEKLRVTRRPEAESTFNVFYYMMAGTDTTLRTELHFNHFAEHSAFGILPQSKPEDKQRASQQFTKLQAAMKVLGISGEEQKAVWLVLGAIYHLGAAGATKAGRKQFARHEWAQKAAYLLGCSLEELSSSIFKHQAKGLQHSTSFRGAPDEAGHADGSGPKVTALECLEAMASGLYSELFTLVISLVNRALKSSQHSLCSLLIVDTPGFQNPRVAQRRRGATFEELCHNYTQERLQTLFHERTFVQELERYKEENIELALDDIESSTSLSVAAIDQASSQALVRTLARTDEARGLLWLMEEEAVQPGGSEETLLDRLFSYYGPAQGENKRPSLLLKGEKPHYFLLGHSHGTDWVEYDAQGWLSHAKHNPAAQNATTLLQDSQKKNISGLFMGRVGGATVLSGSIAGLEGGSKLALRRATSMRKTFTTGMAAVKKKSLCIQIKLQVDALIDTVRRSRVHFVHCLLPKSEAVGGGGEPRVAHGESPDSGLMTLDVDLLRAQLRGSKLLDALRIYRQGYPDHMVFSEFRRRFDVLAPHLTKKHGRHYIVTDEKR